MSTNDQPTTGPDIQVAEFTAQNLFMMEAYTDQTVGTIFRQIPVDFDGNRDPMRQEIFGGACTLLVNQQPVPLQFPINATSLNDAISKWSQSVKDCVHKIREQQIRNKIIMPGGSHASRHPHGRG